MAMIKEEKTTIPTLSGIGTLLDGNFTLGSKLAPRPWDLPDSSAEAQAYPDTLVRSPVKHEDLSTNHLSSLQTSSTLVLCDADNEESVEVTRSYFLSTLNQRAFTDPSLVVALTHTPSFAQTGRSWRFLHHFSTASDVWHGNMRKPINSSCERGA